MILRQILKNVTQIFIKYALLKENVRKKYPKTVNKSFCNKYLYSMLDFMQAFQMHNIAITDVY